MSTTFEKKDTPMMSGVHRDCKNPKCTNNVCTNDNCDCCMSKERNCGCYSEKPVSSMTTFVGTQKEFCVALQGLLELDYDAMEAYQASIERLSSPIYKEKLNEFYNDHLRHTKQLTEILTKRGEKVPSGPDFKKYLTKGKVIIGQINGDKGILQAMLSNEGETNTAYERMFLREDKWEDAKEVISKGFEDAKVYEQCLYE